MTCFYKVFDVSVTSAQSTGTLDWGGWTFFKVRQGFTGLHHTAQGRYSQDASSLILSGVTGCSFPQRWKYTELETAQMSSNGK